MLSGRAMFLLHAEDVEEMPDGWTPSNHQMLRYIRSDYEVAGEFVNLIDTVPDTEPKWKTLIRMREAIDYADVWQFLIDEGEDPMEGL